MANENLEDLRNMKDIISNGVMCPIPWIHFVAYPNGTAQICTHQSDNSVCAGNVFDNTFEEIMNHDNLQKLRVDMMNGKKNSLCSNCYAFEKANNGFSSRTTYIKKYEHLMKDCVSNTNEGGYLDLKFFKFAYWNFKISGVCNLKCRTCHPHFSTSIYQEQKLNEWLSETDTLDVEKIRNKLPLVMIEILKHIEHVEEIHFVGGEPMFMNEHWQILDALIEYNRRDVRLAYHTNLTKLTFKKKHIFDYWRQLKGAIWLSPSIDALYERNTYIRDGTKWEIINQNLEIVLEIKKRMNNLTVVPTITASVLNVYYLDELVDFFHSKKLETLNFNIVRDPSFYHVSLLPDHLKNETIYKLDKCAQRNGLDKNVFNIIKSELFNNQIEHLKFVHLYLFKEETLKLDKVRNLDFSKMFPELKELVE